MYTKIPELWNVYSLIASMTPIIESGRSLAGAAGFLIGANLPYTHDVFWNAMIVFLSADNESFFRKMNFRRAQAKIKKR